MTLGPRPSEEIKRRPYTVSSEIPTECPGGCGVTGPGIYVATAHPITCDWMLYRGRRCVEHDELLRPDEESCPAREVPDYTPDPHGRLRLV